jgi:hypothetical protein
VVNNSSSTSNNNSRSSCCETHKKCKDCDIVKELTEFYKDGKTVKNNCKEFIDSGKIKYLKGKTSDVVNECQTESFDVILIDVDHSYKGVITDIYNYLPKLKNDGYLVFHDYGCWKWIGVKQACDQVTNEGKIQFLFKHDRIAVFKKTC